PALTELKARRQSGSVKSLRDLARWQDSDWSAFFAKTGLPPGLDGDTPEAKINNYASDIQSVLHASFPTEHLRGRAAPPAAPLGLKFMPALAAANPKLDLARPLPDTPDWGSIAPADQPAARDEWNAFQREAITFRRMPARTLLAHVREAKGANP